MEKNDIINYVMTTPGNTNRAVLDSMLNQIETEGDFGESYKGMSVATLTFNITLPEGANQLTSVYRKIWFDGDPDSSTYKFSLRDEDFETTNIIKVPLFPQFADRFGDAFTTVFSVKFYFDDDMDNAYIISSEDACSISGDATYDAEFDNFYVTGDAIATVILVKAN